MAKAVGLLLAPRLRKWASRQSRPLAHFPFASQGFLCCHNRHRFDLNIDLARGLAGPPIWRIRLDCRTRCVFLNYIYSLALFWSQKMMLALLYGPVFIQNFRSKFSLLKKSVTEL